MKRILILLLSVYIIFLTCTPCADDEIRNSCSRLELVKTNATDTHKDHTDSCSPFCTCSCCSLPFQVEKPCIEIKDNSLPRTVLFYFNSPIKSLFSFSIWEPPKSC
jgi:hypothetical protein